jgi:hypothetical protein
MHVARDFDFFSWREAAPNARALLAGYLDQQQLFCLEMLNWA